MPVWFDVKVCALVVVMPKAKAHANAAASFLPVSNFIIDLHAVALSTNAAHRGGEVVGSSSCSLQAGAVFSGATIIIKALPRPEERYL